MNCRHRTQPLEHVFLGLGFAPPSNAYLTADDLHAPETWYPHKLYVCAHCWLVHTEDYARADALFRADYSYFPCTSNGWPEHARRFVEAMREHTLDYVLILLWNIAAEIRHRTSYVQDWEARFVIAVPTLRALN